MQDITSAVLGRLGSVVLPGWAEGANQVRYIPGVLEPPWARRLPLPVDLPHGSGQTIALASSVGDLAARFERPTGQDAHTAAYQARPRTRVFESIEVNSDGWPALVTHRLSSLVGRRVACTLYQSAAGDDSLGAHHDAWWGVIVQLRGAKHWRIWAKGCDGPPTRVVLTPGDVLLLPADITHAVSTPRRSTHLVFAATDYPIVTG